METTTDSKLGKYFQHFNPSAILNNKKLIIFSICLFLATILWFLNALSKSYTTTVAYPVKYLYLPKNKFLVNNPPNKLNIKVTAHGFTLLRYKMSMSFAPIVLDINQLLNENKSYTDGIASINSSTLVDNISSQISHEMDIQDIKPPKIDLIFDSLESKKVPVKFNSEIIFSTRFNLTSSVKITPPQVLITGPRELVQNIDSILTINRIFKNVDESISKELALIAPENIKVEPAKVLIFAPVDEFTEKRFTVPVWIENQPENQKVKLFPQEVEVSFSTGLSSFSLIKPEEFSLFVAWDDITKNLSALPVRAKKLPPNLKSLKISPENVEYLIEKK